MQRTEPLPLPILILLVLVAIGFVWAVLVCGAQLKTRKAAIAFGFSFVAAGAVWWASYGQSEVWELELETVGAMAIGAVPAAYGAATRVFQGKKEKKEEEGQG